MLMGRQLDEGAGAWLRKAAAGCEIEIRTGVTIVSIDGDEKVTGVTLEGEEQILADLVIISAGVRSCTDLALQAGLEVKKSVVVNEQMKTSLPDIYACGDCAEYQGMNYGVWSQAAEQGKIAGANAAGEEKAYRPVQPALTFHGMNTALYAAGDNGKNSRLLYKTLEYQDMGKGQYKKCYFLNDRLCGVILLGDLKEMGRLSGLLERHASYEEVGGVPV